MICVGGYFFFFFFFFGGGGGGGGGLSVCEYLCVWLVCLCVCVGGEEGRESGAVNRVTFNYACDCIWSHWR